MRFAYFSRVQALKNRSIADEKHHRILDTLFAHFLMDLASILTSKMEPFATEGLQKTSPKSELENGTPTDGKHFSCGRIPVAPLPPITCSGKPAPKSDLQGAGGGRPERARKIVR